MKGLLGRKIGMTQVFDAEGNVTPVTVVAVGGNVVIQKKSEEGKDGYSAIKIGFGDAHKFEKEGTEPKWRLNRPQVGVFLKAGIDTPKKHVREFRVNEADLANYEVGQVLGATTFRVGEFIDVAGISKGRGYSGVMKRHNFSGTKASHGVHEFFRHGGSIGCSAYPARVFKGKRMAGQYGNTRVTVQNLVIVQVREEDNLLLIKGAIPGPNNSIVEIRPAVKKVQ